jgi:ABC-type transport system involved in multi-copper enzyme maturation permease subunit
MNANAQVIRSTTPYPTPHLPLQGFRNYFRKEMLEWFRTKRAVTTLIVASGLLALGAFSERMRVMFKLGLDVIPANLDPDFNAMAANWSLYVFLFAAFATMGLLAAECERGTLAWSVSMPLDRTTVLIAKAVSACAVFAVVAVIVPALVVAIVCRICYGGWPSLSALTWMPLASYAVAVFVIVLNLTLSTFIRSQAFVIGTTICFALVMPGLVSSLAPDVARLLPTSIASCVVAFGTGQAVNPITPIAWGASIAILLTIAAIRLRNMEL